MSQEENLKIGEFEQKVTLALQEQKSKLRPYVTEIDPDGAELQYCGSYRTDMPCELEACKKSYPPKNVFNRGGKPKRWLVFKEYLWG